MIPSPRYIHICLMIDSTSADDFNVTLPFLLQQAAWLYDRQLSQVRAQMLKVGNTHSQSPYPAPAPALGSVSGSGALGGQAMRRVGSGGGSLNVGDSVWINEAEDWQDPVFRQDYPLFRKTFSRRGWKAALLRRKPRVLHIPSPRMSKEY